MVEETVITEAKYVWIDNDNTPHFLLGLHHVPLQIFKCKIIFAKQTRFFAHNFGQKIDIFFSYVLNSCWYFIFFRPNNFGLSVISEY